MIIVKIDLKQEHRCEFTDVVVEAVLDDNTLVIQMMQLNTEECGIYYTKFPISANY